MGKVVKAVVFAAAAALLLPTGPFLAIGITSAWTMWAVGTAAIFALQTVSRALGPKAPRGAGEMNAPVRSSIPSRTYIYGRARVAGTLIFSQGYGSDNEYMAMVWAVAAHEVAAFEKFFLDNDEIILSGNAATGDLAGYLNVYWHYGTAAQAADTVLTAAIPSKWTADHKLSGTAYYVLRAKYKDKKWPNGLRQSYVLVRGKELYDPRKDSTVPGGAGSHRANDPATWEWSENPALAWLDYLTDSYVGCQIPITLVDLASVIAAANVCDEAVALKAGGTQPRYTINAVIDSGASREDNIGQILSAMGGRHVEQGGLFSVYAAAWTTPTVTFDEDDLAGNPEVTWKVSRRDRFNAVKGVFLDTDNQYQAGEIPLRVNPTWETQDGGDRLWQDVNLPVTADHRRAQRLAQIAVKQGRKEITVNWPCNLKGLLVRANDTVYLNYARYGWAAKSFRVLEWSLSTDGVVNLLLKEEDASVYSWTAATDELDKPSTTGVTTHDPATAYQPTGFAATAISVTGTGGTVSPGVKLSWDAVTSPYIRELEIQWKQNASTSWTPVNGEDPAAGEQIVPNLMPGVVHNFRARFVSTTGVVGDWVSVNATTLTSLIAGEASSVTWENIVGAPLLEELLVTFDYADQVAFEGEWEYVLDGTPGSGEISFANSNSVPTGRHIVIGNNAGNDERWCFWKGPLIPFNISDLYEVGGQFNRAAGASALLYCGVEGIAADGVTLVNVSGANSHGSQHYAAAAGAGPTLGSWGAVRGYFKGKAASATAGVACPNPAAPGTLHNDVAFIRPMFIVNYSDQAGQTYVGSLWIKRFRGALATADAADFSTQVTGSSKPESLATRNEIYRQSSDPGAVANGSYWYNTTTAVLYQRVGGAWVVAATYNTGALANKNQTDTADIVAFAATVPYATSFAGPVTGDGSGNWQDLCSIASVTAVGGGAAIIIGFTCRCAALVSSAVVDFRVVRDSTAIYTVGTAGYSSNGGIVSINCNDAPGAGTYTYKLQMKVNTGTGNAKAENGYLNIVSAKR